MRNVSVDAGPGENVVEVVQLLHWAVALVGAKADAAPGDASLQDLALGVLLAHGQAVGLLPEGRVVDEGEPDGEASVLALLTAAEGLTRLNLSPDIDHADLVVELCALISQARALEC